MTNGTAWRSRRTTEPCPPGPDRRAGRRAGLAARAAARAGQPRARQTTVVTMPFAVRWCLLWKAITDALVLGPKSPSTTGPASAFCRTLTVAFRSPSFSVTFSYAAYRPVGAGCR